jgi:glycosyltransferase involved in cell wall biosynthesis
MLELTAKFQPDVIHQVNHIFDTVFLSAYAAKKLGIPLVGSITTPIQSNSPLVHNVMGLADLATVYHFGVRHWKRIICSDSTQARYVRDRYGSRVDGRLVTDIFVGVHERYENQKPSQRASSPHIVTVGHVHELRDPTNIIRAMPTVLARFPDACFEIGGRVQFQRPLRETARLGLQQAVRFLGEVNAEQVADLVSKAHVFAILHQCRYAGLSFTAIEAMQFATPVVINTTDDLYGPGVIKDGENIMLVDGKNPGEIAAALMALLQDAALRDRIGRNGKEFVKQHLTWERCAEKTEHLYRSLR